MASSDSDDMTPSSNLTILNNPSSTQENPKYTIWFDIDNTLYSRHCKINEHMSEKIQAYFLKLGLPQEEARKLHVKYYQEYGLAIRGLIRHHSIDPLDYDKNCDLAIPLEEILKPDQSIRKLLLDIDRSKARIWCITNAYKTHALRVLNVMNLSDLIEGVISCDYTNLNFHCKPEKEFYQEAILRSYGTEKLNQENLNKVDFKNHLLVDDSLINIIGATKLGFASSVHYDEDSNFIPNSNLHDQQHNFKKVSSLDQLRSLEIWKDCFL